MVQKEEKVINIDLTLTDIFVWPLKVVTYHIFNYK